MEGPFEKIGPDTFRLKLQKGLGAELAHYALIMVATHLGDAHYKPAIQQAQLNVPARNSRGSNQTITFPVIPDQHVGAAPITLAATSSAGVPVSYFIRHGPAELDGNQLRLTSIPPRATFPMEVTIIAWQYGHSADPALKTAEPVERSFMILK